ncbi:chromosomal replication initiator protein DnaA [Periweissella beninensis]|uniref:chromosomal replication initiator protein DnaA n=1 Tax=Periweissella beninensis TaxID=504936 RepID=UPI0021A6600B|nr:chromosomal replication initiator protein DnaA [Periweissella beninensis]MCT4396485.1 chromosomal replication initiator protein DnaA [Periweissella beninensis]
MVERNTLWSDITDRFREELGRPSYDNFIQPARLASFDASQHNAVIEVPNELSRERWLNTYSSQFTTFAFETNQMLLSNIDVRIVEPVVDLIEEIEKNDRLSSQQMRPGDSTKTTLKHGNNLDAKYIFDTFVVGATNQLAYGAALAVSEGSLEYNPLLLYGGVGLGKTHLMQATGNNALVNNPNQRVLYVTSEQFTNDFISAVRNGTTEKLREEYRNADLLLVDDVQFLSGKESTQEEFFHTFNDILGHSGRIVMTSDRLPKDIPDLQDRLVSRFQWGLSVDINKPDFETRIAILLEKAEKENISVDRNVIEFIAKQVDSNVRELEGVFKRVAIMAKFNQSAGDTVSIDDATKILAELDIAQKSEITISFIQETVAKFFAISISDLKGKKRNKEIVMPRQIAMYLSRELTDNSLPNIGREFGGKDHTTVMHATDKISAALESNKLIQNQITTLKKQINGD